MIGVSEVDISPPVVMLAATLVRMAHPTNENLHNALSKAETRLFTHAWQVSGGVLRIESESGVGTFRLTDGDRCDCPTKKYICWHRGAHFILSVLAAANIAPLKAASVPLVERGPRSAAAADDPASLGNFLDRPEIAAYDEEEDVFFADNPALAAQDALVDKYADPIWIDARKAATTAYARRYAASPERYKAEYAYGAAYRAARNAGLQDAAAHDVAKGVMDEHTATLHTTVDTTSVVPSHETDNKPPAAAVSRLSEAEREATPLGRRSKMQDGELEKRRRLADVPRDRPEEYLWSTADYSEEENDKKIIPHIKEPPYTVITGGPPDPFGDVL